MLSAGGTLLTCEETRYPETANRPGLHTWHRSVDFYEQLFAPLTLRHSEEFPEIDRLAGIESPGRVMLWVRATPA